MNFGKFDFGILIIMSMAVIAMSFVFPALGVVGDRANSSDIPEFNVTEERFDFARDFPDTPGTPSEGILYINEKKGADAHNEIWLEGDTSSGYSITLLNDGNISDPQPKILHHNWTNGNTVTEEAILYEEDDFNSTKLDGYEVNYEWIEYYDSSTGNMEVQVQFNVVHEPGESNGFSAIPVLGTIIGGGEILASIVGWIGSIIFWFIGTLLVTIANLIGVTFDFISFGINLIHWLLSTYWSIVDSAPGFASVVVAVPGILLSLIFTKVVYITVEVLWIG